MPEPSAVLYAAKSTKDPNGSIKTQIQDGRKIAAERGWTVAGEFQDENKTAYKGDRGTGLVDAMRRCEELSPCALIVQHSDRLARGDGKMAKHLVHYVLWALKKNVEIVSKQDPEMVSGEYAVLMGAVGGMRNNEDSKRKQAAIRDGMHRMFERGDRPGRTPAGYKTVTERNDAGKDIAREVIKDPDMEPTMDRMFKLALEEKLSPAAIARSLNKDGHRNANGGAWMREDVKRLLLNPFFAGVMVYGGVEKDGTHPTYITPEQHKDITDRLPRHSRAAGSGNTEPGRRALGHLLHGLAVCGRCGARMYAETSSYTRKDGTHKRLYTCSHHRHADGICKVQVDAGRVDVRLAMWLDELMADFDGWHRQVLASVEPQRLGAQKQLDELLAELDENDRMAGRIDADYLKAIKRGEDGMFYGRQSEKMTIRRRKIEDAVKLARDALAQFEESALVDEMLDFSNSLRNLTVDQVNEQLRAEFKEFRITIEEDGWVEAVPVPLHPGPVVDIAAMFAAHKDDDPPEAADFG